MSDRNPSVHTQLEQVGEPALKFLAEQAQAAAGATGKVQVLQLPGLPEGTGFVYGPDGKIEEIAVPRPWRQHTLLSVAEIPAHLAHWEKLHDSDTEDAYLPHPAVWYCPDQVAVVLDDNPDSHRRDLITCPLEYTDAYRLLQRCADGHQRAWEQKEFIRVLRTTLWDCLGDQAGSLLATLRTVSGMSRTSVESDQQKDRSNMGVSVEKEIKSKHGDIPEEVVLHVRVYQDPSLQTQRRIRCALESDPQSLQFWLIPLAGQLEDALHAEMAFISQLLDSELDAPVFYGRP